MLNILLAVITALFIAAIYFIYNRSRRISVQEAEKIMGMNYFGVPSAEKCFGLKPKWWQKLILSHIPFTETTLEECKDTHILVAVFPLSILDIRSKVKNDLFYSHEDAWYNNQVFAKDKGNVCWQLIRKTPVENSTSKSYQDQQSIFAKNEETPAARIMTYVTIGHFLATGERLFENVYVRCSDVDSDGVRVVVGVFVSDGLRVYGLSDDCCSDGLGLASARKFR